MNFQQFVCLKCPKHALLVSWTESGYSIHVILSSKRKPSTKCSRYFLQLFPINITSFPIATTYRTTRGLRISYLYRWPVRDLDVVVAEQISGNENVDHYYKSGWSDIFPNLSVPCTNAGLFLAPHFIQIKIHLLAEQTEKRSRQRK